MNDYKNNSRDRYDSRSELPIERNALIELTKDEQDHRHRLQENQQKANNSSYFFGMIFGFLYNITLLYFVYYLVEKGHNTFALNIFLINAAIIVGSFGLLTFSRKMSFNKRPFNKNYNNSDRKKFNNKK